MLTATAPPPPLPRRGGANHVLLGNGLGPSYDQGGGGRREAKPKLNNGPGACYRASSPKTDSKLFAKVHVDERKRAEILDQLPKLVGG